MALSMTSWDGFSHLFSFHELGDLLGDLENIALNHNSCLRKLSIVLVAMILDTTVPIAITYYHVEELKVCRWLWL